MRLPEDVVGLVGAVPNDLIAGLIEEVLTPYRKDVTAIESLEEDLKQKDVFKQRI